MTEEHANLNTASQWDGVYTNWRDQGTIPVRRAEMAATHEALLALIPDTSGKLLDVGCGLGLLLEELDTHRRALQLYAVDFSQLAVIIAGGAVPLAIVDQLDVRDGLPWSAGFFDVTFCGHIVEHLEDPTALLREMARVTKPGGVVIVNFPHGDTPYELHVHDALTYDIVTGWMAAAGVRDIVALPLIEGAPVDNGILWGRA